MCGLIAFLRPELYENPEAVMDLALNTISHRGLPGRKGMFVGDDVVLGHVRLPIRGLGPEFDQPFRQDNWVGLFVGEVFDTIADNDALYALDLLYTDGPEALAQHDGFWSIVQYSEEFGTVSVVLDHLAIKPLYYHASEGIISSELRAIEFVAHNLTLDDHYLSNVLKWGYDPSFRTPYKEVVRLEPGMMYTFINGQMKLKEHYFKLEPATLNLRQALDKAIENRLIASDVPVSALCSGGLDSTIVAMTAAQYGMPMTVFHIDNNEEQYFDLIKWPNNVTIQKLALEPVRLEYALAATEEPVDLGSVLPQYQLGRAVRDAGFSVVLSGDGADELFGGYKRASQYDSQHSDVFSELVHYHLPRLDKTMMASTVELRSPFLAPDVVRTALNVPYYLRTAKQVLKASYRDLVPIEILNRSKEPLKTEAVKTGGVAYRQQVVDTFIRRRTT